MAEDPAAETKSRLWPKGLVGFFDAGILALYQNQNEKYELRTDYFEGSLTLRSDYYERLKEDYII
jgi:hypothetical protein